MGKRIRSGLLTSIIVLALAAAGCAKTGERTHAPGNSSAPAASAEDLVVTENVTLKLFSHFAALNTTEDVESLFAPVMKRHPNIKIELVKGKMVELIAADEVPDLIATTNLYMNDMLVLGLGSDLSEFVKKYGVDLNKFQPEAIQALKLYGKNGELYGIPYTMNYGLLIYNKDIFNKFGVPYPKDGMKWEEIIDLSKRLTRLDGGIQYRGFDPGTEATFARSYSLGTVDTTGKSVLNSEGYKKVFGLLVQFYSIPGYISNNNQYKFGTKGFYTDQTLAMFPTWLAAISSQLKQLKAQGREFNWDVAAHPSFDDRPGLGREVEFQSLMVPPNSKNREAAYRIIQTVVSEEAQRSMNSENNLTILDDPKLRAEFASKTELYKGKNLAGIFKVKPAPSPIPSEFDEKLYSFLGEATKSMVLEKQDINTVLRIANEKGDKYIQSVKSQ